MPGGRPPELDRVAYTRRDGTPVTTSEQLLERIRLGLSREEAAASAGIAVATFYNWQAAAAKARTRRETKQKITDKDRRYLAFLEDLEKADSEAELRHLAVIERATQPFTVTKVVERTEITYDPNGTPHERVVERTETKETKAGLWTASAWWLERRRPQKYARRYEVSGPEGGPITVQEQARNLADQLSTYLQGVNDSELAEAG